MEVLRLSQGVLIWR